MSFRTGILGAIDQIRAIAGPGGLDIRTNTLSIITRTWSGSSLGDGTYTDSVLVLKPHYPIRYLTAGEISASAGQYEIGDVSVNHITPSDGNVGYLPTQLKPIITTNNQEVIYRIVGSHGGEYGLRTLETYRPFSYRLVLTRRSTTP